MNTIAYSERASLLQTSGIREMFQRAKSYTNVINLGIGEPDFPTPSHIVDAAVNALARGETRYTANAGNEELRIAIAQKMATENNLPVDEGNVIVTVGGMEGLMLAIMSVLNPNDEVIVFTPSWPNYISQLTLVGARIVEVPCSPEDGFSIDLDQLESVCTNNTRAIIINNPCNPTGKIMSKDELIVIASIAIKYNLWIISDEVYEKIIFSKKFISIGSLPDIFSRVITVNSFSKTYAMTGWRVGYVVADKNLIKIMIRIQENIAACVTSFSQQGALAALNNSQQIVTKMVGEYKRRRDVLESVSLSSQYYKVLPSEGTFYVLLKIKTSEVKDFEVARRMLDVCQVVTVPGSTFGPAGKNFLRISLTASCESIIDAFSRINSNIEKIFID